MDGAASKSLPSSVSEVEELIKKLYKPGPAAQYGRINDQLLQLQLSPYGWKLADELMNSDDPNVRFYAALTFTVKLNNDGPSLDAETAEEVQLRLITWLIRSVSRGEKPIVCKKMCTALIAYFLRSPTPWLRPLRDIAISLHRGEAIVGDATTSEDTASLLEQALRSDTFTPRHCQILLWFAGALAEELNKLSTREIAYARFHQEMATTVFDAVAVMRAVWHPRSSEPEDESSMPYGLQAEALRTFSIWVVYSHSAWPEDCQQLHQLRSLIGLASQCLGNEELVDEAIETFREMLDTYPVFFLDNHMTELGKAISSIAVAKLDPGSSMATDDSDDIPIVQLMVAFCCANIQPIVEHPRAVVETQTLVQIFLNIISTESVPGDDDVLSIQTIEFWNTFIEYVNDTVYDRDEDEEDPVWVNQAKDTLSQAAEGFYNKLWIPSKQQSESWGDAERDAFKEFRLDCTDTMLSILVFIGEPLLQKIISLTLQALEVKRWRGVEAGLFCLNTFSDNVLEDTTNDETIGALFRSPLFVQIADFTQTISTKTRQTAIEMLGQYSKYIERHPEFVTDTIRFLFASLEMATLANGAAKNIDSFCSECRTNLINMVPDFLQQYQRFLQAPTCEPYTKQKVIGGIASIIQAITPESGKAQPLLALLSNVEKDVEAAKRYAAAGDDEMTELVGVSALECLKRIGKAMQVPSDVPIQLYEDDEVEDQANFWDTQDGRLIQLRIISCFSVLQVVGKHADAVDAACLVLRSGYSEREPGPFVLPVSDTVNFVKQCAIDTPALESVLSTVSMLLASHRNDGKITNAEVETLYDHVADFAEQLGTASADPGVAAGCINVFERLLPNFATVFFGNVTEAVLNLALSGIVANEPQAKKAASAFWTAVVKAHSVTLPEADQRRRAQIMTHYIPKLVRALVEQISGQAYRSDLDQLYEPLKALLLFPSNIQALLQQAVGDIPSATIDASGRERFLRQLSAARNDGTIIKQVVKQFWAACRGTLESFAS